MDLTSLTLYHGSAAESVTPTFGLGDDRHDYGKGFYLSDDLSLAKEWAVCRPNDQNGWVHAFKVTDPNLSVLDFQELGVLAWMAELMLGGLGIQYCIKSPRAFAALSKVSGYPRPVAYGEYNNRYNERDRQARDRMDELISGPANKAVRVMSTLVEGDA